LRPSHALGGDVHVFFSLTLTPPYVYIYTSNFHNPIYPTTQYTIHEQKKAEAKAAAKVAERQREKERAARKRREQEEEEEEDDEEEVGWLDGLGWLGWLCVYTPRC
jgi:hypothetical protein